MKLRAHSKLVVLLEVFFVFYYYERGMTNVIRFTKGKRSLTFSEEDWATDKKGKNKKLIHTVLRIQAHQMTMSIFKPLNPNSTNPPLSNQKSYFLQPLVIELPPKNLSIAPH